MRINCLIIDDEPTSQLILQKFIRDVEFLHLSGICSNAIEAIRELKNNSNIELLFLDINMPKISGLTFYKSLQSPPFVIFTTAYSQYAVDGFEVNAIDFLLKPFSFERFFNAVNKVVEKKYGNQNGLNEDHSLLIKSDKTLHKIASDKILFIEAFGDYVKVYLEDRYLLTNSTFCKILKLLPENKFVRTHKSFAVNLDKIDSIKGNQISVANHIIPIGQTYKESFLKVLNNPN